MIGAFLRLWNRIDEHGTALTIIAPQCARIKWTSRPICWLAKLLLEVVSGKNYVLSMMKNGVPTTIDKRPSRICKAPSKKGKGFFPPLTRKAKVIIKRSFMAVLFIIGLSMEYWSIPILYRQFAEQKSSTEQYKARLFYPVDMQEYESQPSRIHCDYDPSDKLLFHTMYNRPETSTSLLRYQAYSQISSPLNSHCLCWPSRPIPLRISDCGVGQTLLRSLIPRPAV
jgi:hypothetical protein